MNKKTLGLALLLLVAAAGCGKHAAATLLGHPNDTLPRQHGLTTKESDRFHEECRWNRKLFC